MIHKNVIGLFLFFILLTTLMVIKWPDRYVHIVFCDVGQGDSILIYQGFSQILIDSGPDERVLSCLGRHMPFWDRSIELVVATHYDSDHIGGMKSVFDFYYVATVLTLPFETSSQQFDDLKERLELGRGEGLIVKKPFLGQNMRFSSGMNFTVVSSLASDTENQQFLQENEAVEASALGPRKEFSSWFEMGKTVKNLRPTESTLSDAFFKISEEEESKNDLSIALLFNFNDTNVLLTGDLEESGERAMIQQGLTVPVNVLKAGHHGSKTSSSLDFLRTLQPEFAIISSGKNNSYNHPSPQTLENLTRLGIKIYRIDELGEREMITDGKIYWFKER